MEQGGTEMYLIRHADALPMIDAVVQGQYNDQPLSELGCLQSRALAARMSALLLSAIYCSPIKRARQTASFLAASCGVDIQIEHDVREVGCPPLANQESSGQAAAIRASLSEVETAILRSGIWSQIPGCEPSAILRARLLSAVTRIAKQHAGQRVAIVTHSGAINAYLAALLGLERDYFFPAANTSLSVLRVKEQHHLLLSLNDVAHLLRAGIAF
jgi:broad specificity phosphatase PhoE